MTSSLRSTGRAVTATATSTANQVAGWVPPLARFGYAAKGAVYVIVGYIAAKAASAAGTPTGASGALAELLDETYGHWLLAGIALGLAAHVLWRVVQAALDPEHRDEGKKRLLMRVFYLVSGVIYGSLALSALAMLRGRSQGGDDSHRSQVALLMEQPFGEWLVGLIGMGVIGYGLYQLYKAFTGDVIKRMGIADPQQHRGIVAIGRIGTAARGVVLAMVGIFLVDAARRYDASAAGGTQDALRWFGHGWALTAIAVGVMAYGVLQFAKAAYRRIDRPRV